MIKDRLLELKASQEEMEEVNLAVTIEVTSEQASMDMFFSQMEEVQDGIRKLESTVPKIRKKHSEILSTTHNDGDLKRELDDLTAEMKRVASKVNAKLKELSWKEDEEDNNNQRANVRIRRTQHGAASRQFVEVMTEYHHVQEEYRDRCRDMIKRQLQITGKDPTEDELDEMLEKENLEIFTQGIMSETIQAKQQLADIEKRHQEIIKLETSIKELHDLFMDMAIMVQSQGETIDNIAAHVASTQDYVETAKIQTGEALMYQGKARKKKIICGIIVLVVLVILAVVIALSV